MLCAALAGLAPIGVSIVAVFLFAGPHNWMEFRFFLSKMPARWGPMRPFFIAAIGGVVGLSGLWILIPFAANYFSFSVLAGIWNSLLVGWVVLLLRLHSSRPRGPGFKAIVCLGFAIAWGAASYGNLFLIYAHPLLALWFLDRELGRRRSDWRGAYRVCLSAVPLLILLIWMCWMNSPVRGEDVLTARLGRDVGSSILRGASVHSLIATHAFLELLHYSVWLAAIPLVSLRVAPWRLAGAPLMRKSANWRRIIAGVLLVGLAIVLLLWASFLADYPLTRDIYFAVAITHVLAEVPFLLRTF